MRRLVVTCVALENETRLIVIDDLLSNGITPIRLNAFLWQTELHQESACFPAAEMIGKVRAVAPASANSVTNQIYKYLY